MLYYEKVATKEQELNSIYGWNYYNMITDIDRKLYDIKPLYQPGTVLFKDCKAQKSGEDTRLHIEWYPAADGDNDLQGYKVYVSHKSRGWDYNEFAGDEAAKQYWSIRSGWKPEMYERLFQIPLYELFLEDTKDTSIDLDISSPGVYYITVMPYDAHGLSVGKDLYYMSNELKVTIE